MKSEPSLLRDFTVDKRVWLISAVAVVIGCGATVLAVVLLRLIGLCTNLFYYHRFDTALVSPAGSSLGYWMVLVPVIGGLLVGLMARYGSDKIRGHGIPEAIEAILLNRARVEPKIALLKPISAAIAIGSGGPFGAEGPIIMTGGAFGSLIAQWMHLTDAERTTLLVAGAAAGMSAILQRLWRRFACSRVVALRVEASEFSSGCAGEHCGCPLKNALAGIRSALSYDCRPF